MGGTAIHGRKKRQVLPLFAEEKLALRPLPAERFRYSMCSPSLCAQVGVATRRNSELIFLIAPCSALNGTHSTHRSTAASRFKA